MGTIRNGANGGFSGKAGSVIGSSWNNISYIKGLPKLSNKPASEAQLIQRARFAAVMGYLGPIKDVLMLGYKGQTSNRATGFNMGVQHALNNAVAGVYPYFTVDKSMVQISKGTLQAPADVTLVSTTPEDLVLSWMPQVNDLTSFVDDRVYLLVYNAEQNLFMIYTAFATRSEGTSTITLPASFSGQEIHVYMFYQSRDGGRQSNSVYKGPFTVA